MWEWAKYVARRVWPPSDYTRTTLDAGGALIVYDVRPPTQKRVRKMHLHRVAVAHKECDRLNGGPTDSVGSRPN